MILATLLLLVSLSDIKAATQQHLMAMVNIRGEENGQRISGDQPASFVDGKGMYLTNYWYGLLQDTQRWKFIPEGDHYRYEEHCQWFHKSIPCTGEIYTDGPHIRRITQRLSGATIDMRYDWYDLHQRRLLPTSLSFRIDHRELKIRWTNYEEFYTTEPIVKEIDGP